MSGKSGSVAIYTTDDGRDVQVQFVGNEGWTTQAGIQDLFGVSQGTVSQHIANIFEEGELDRETSIRKSNRTPSGGGRTPVEYSLDVVISVGYRVSGVKATRFRQWATAHLRSLLTDGYSLNTDDPEALKNLAAKIRELRSSERELYRRVRDIFKETAVDYLPNSDQSRTFFATVQDKFHYAVTGKTSAQIILERCDGAKPDMGMRSVPDRRITVGDAKVGKNYLTEDELHVMHMLGEQFMLFAESSAFRGKQMTMEEISTKLNMILMANGYEVLYEYSDTFDRGPANAKADAEFQKYQNQLGSGR